MTLCSNHNVGVKPAGPWIKSSPARVSSTIGDITAASQAQSDGVKSGNVAIRVMGGPTHQNAALVAPRFCRIRQADGGAGSD
jgi:hypothetical protein